MNRAFTDLHFPMYYFYDALQGLRVLAKLGYEDDERMKDAVHLVMSKRRPDGKWILESDWFNQPAASTKMADTKVEKEICGTSGPLGKLAEGLDAL